MGHGPWGREQLDTSERLSTPIHRWTGSEQRHFALTHRQEGRVPWGRLLCIHSILLVKKATRSKG